MMEKHKIDLDKDIELVCATFSGKNYWETIPSFDLELSGMYLSDGGHGIRKQVTSANKLGLQKGHPATVFPSGTALGCSFNTKLAYQIGKAIGEEALYYKVNIILGPSMNIKRSPLCGRNFEYFSEDPYLTGKLAGNIAKGIESNGVASCLKHFCLNNQETNRFNSNVIVDTKALNDIYLFPFKMAIKEANPSCVMTSYNLFNGFHVNESRYLLIDKLRNEYEFKGLVMSDWGAIDDRVKAFKATNDLEMPTSNGYNDQKIIDAYLDKKISKNQIMDSFKRIQDVDLKTNKALMNNNGNLDHLQISLKAAEECIVLLKNNRNILPLSADDKGLIIGPYAFKNRIQGGGSGMVNPQYRKQIYDIYKEYSINIAKVLHGFTVNQNAKEDHDYLKETLNYIKLIKPKYAIVFFGLDDINENEGVDRKNIDLPKNQIEFIHEVAKYDIDLIGVLVSGNVVHLKEVLDDFVGLIYAPLLGMEGSRAILNTLTGINAPSGRLSETWAKDYIDYPNSNIFAKEDFLTNDTPYKESIYIGYRYFQTFKKKVLYPFGYGLSYATFSYDDFKVDKNGVSFRSTNTSLITSKDVVEIFIEKVNSTYLRPSRELKAFKKYELAPGESKVIVIPFDEWTFITYDEEKDVFVNEDGKYIIHIAKNAQQDIYQQEIDLIGDEISKNHEYKYLECYKDGSFKILSDESFYDSLTYTVINKHKKVYNNHKNIIVCDYNTLIMDLSHCKSKLISFAVKLMIKKVNKLYKKGKAVKANNIYSGVLNQPIRSLFLMSNGIINSTQLDDLIYAANGHPFKGIRRFFKHKPDKSVPKKSDRF